MAFQRSKSQDVRAAAWNVRNMVGRSGGRSTQKKDLLLLCSRDEVDVRGYLVLFVKDTSSFDKAVIRGLLVLVCLLLRDGLTVLSI